MTSQRKRVAMLLITMTAIGMIWCFVLPLIGRLASVKQRIGRFHDAEIDPTAVFYSDHPGMGAIERRIDSIVNHPDRTFWIVSSSTQSTPTPIQPADQTHP